MTEPVRILPLTIKKIKVHLSASVRDVHLGKGSPPLLDRLLEREIRIHLRDNITGHEIGLIPRLERGGTALFGGETFTRLLHDGPRSLLQGIQDGKELVLAKSFRLGDLVVIIILVSECLCLAIADLDQFHESMIAHEISNLAQALPARLPDGLVGIHAELGPQTDAAHLLKGTPGHVGAQHQIVALTFQLALDLGRLRSQSLGLLGFHDVAPKGSFEHLECFGRQFIVIVAASPRGHLFQQCSCLGQLGLVGQKCLHLSLGPRQLFNGIVGTGQRHLGPPELHLKVPMEPLVLRVDGIDEGLGL
mmetsp:Transcript_15057/g.43534  ORF Transcript_15057/g.43534 Transcript_15057/m.43534 type:complete len:305 (-) Transcript_15057:199-1113(-)